MVIFRIKHADVVKIIARKCSRLNDKHLEMNLLSCYQHFYVNLYVWFISCQIVTLGYLNPEIHQVQIPKKFHMKTIQNSSMWKIDVEPMRVSRIQLAWLDFSQKKWRLEQQIEKHLVRTNPPCQQHCIFNFPCNN